jgi:hypothetical protein
VDRVAADEAEAEGLRQATADLPDGDRLAPRVAHLRAIVAWADALQHDRGPRPAAPDQERTPLEAAVALAHRLLADRDDPDQGDQVRSVVDPDARGGKHGAYCDGDRLDLSLDADRARLTALHLLPGNGAAARDAQTLWAAAERAQGHNSEAVSMAGMGWNGAVLRAWRAPAGLGVEVFVPPPPEPIETPFCRPEACVLDAPRGVVTCPGGQQTATKERRANDTGWKLVCARRQGAGCARHAWCLATLPQQKGRRVIKHDDQAEDDAARERATPAPYAAGRQPHPRLERQLAAIVRYHKGRRCRYRGQWRVQVQ